MKFVRLYERLFIEIDKVKILILGGDGMLGHRLLLHMQDRHEACVTLRCALSEYARHGIFNAANAFANMDVRHFDQVAMLHKNFRPDVVINAVGVVKQRPESEEGIPAIEINALLPHRLAQLCREQGSRLLHLSTDCVFSGTAGNYREEDIPDPHDLYGRSKLMGEVSMVPCLTLRTSIIGRELSRKTGLFEWFLAQAKGRNVRVKGFRNAIYSGFTTHEMARIIEHMLVNHPDASGIYHVSSAPISKYDLLCMINTTLGLDVEILPDEEFRCDRSLDSTKFKKAFDYVPPSWPFMVRELE